MVEGLFRVKVVFSSGKTILSDLLPLKRAKSLARGYLSSSEETASIEVVDPNSYKPVLSMDLESRTLVKV